MKEDLPKYLVIGEAFYPEEFLINDLVKEWEKDGYQLEILTRSPSYPAGIVFKGYKNKIYQKEKWGNIIIHRFAVIQGYNKSTFIKILNYLSFVVFGSITALFIAKRYKRIFIYHTGPLSLAIPGIIIKKVSHSPVTIWSFDLWPSTIYAYGFKKTKLLSWILDGFVKWIYKNCDNIIVSSGGFVPEIKKYVPDKQVFIAPNWSQTSNIISQKSSVILERGKIHFTFTGNVGKVQNLENVIIGFHNAALVNAQLNIIGDGSHLAFLRNMVSSQNIENVMFHGRIPLSEVFDIYAQSDVLLISLMPDPVMEMTLPLKFQTYLTAAKPIYAVMLGEVNRIVTEYKLGTVAHPSKVDEITDGFKSFDLSSDRKNEISVQCKYLVDSVYNRKSIVNKLSDIFFN